MLTGIIEVPDKLKSAVYVKIRQGDGIVYNTVIFDMDGVIIDSEHIHYEIFKVFSRELGLNIPKEEYNTLVGSTDTRIWTYFKDRYGLPQAVEELVESYAANYLDYLTKAEDVEPIQGVEVLIKDLHGNNIRLALASSASRRNIEIVLDMFDYNKYFETSVSGFEVKNGKPSPDIFLHAAELMRANVSECIVIEDTKNGVNAAKAAGMKCIAFRNPNSGNQDLSAADLIIDRFDEINCSKLKSLF